MSNLPPEASRSLTRRGFGQTAVGLMAMGVVAGCENETSQIGKLETVWGKRGIIDGRLQKPRAMAIDQQDRLYLVDILARIQVFDRDGNFLHGWRTPEHQAGRPTGLAFSHEGILLVADTHYFRVLSYTPEGVLLDSQTIGGIYGPNPGEFGLVTDAVRDAEGVWYISEYGEYDRIHKYSPTGEFLQQWGGHGTAPGEFSRPQNITLDDQNRLWVADACNHRIQVFSTNGELLFHWGEQGSELGQLYFPYDLELDGKGHVYVCEYGNHRIQKFTLEGVSLGSWGTNGRKSGELHNPWAIAYDSRNRIHVLDTNNHRVQRIVL